MQQQQQLFGHSKSFSCLQAKKHVALSHKVQLLTRCQVHKKATLVKKQITFVLNKLVEINDIRIISAKRNLNDLYSFKGVRSAVLDQ